jgi:hypothetical protein
MCTTRLTLLGLLQNTELGLGLRFTLYLLSKMEPGLEPRMPSPTAKRATKRASLRAVYRDRASLAIHIYKLCKFNPFSVVLWNSRFLLCFLINTRWLWCTGCDFWHFFNRVFAVVAVFGRLMKRSFYDFSLFIFCGCGWVLKKIYFSFFVLCFHVCLRFRNTMLSNIMALLSNIYSLYLMLKTYKEPPIAK